MLSVFMWIIEKGGNANEEKVLEEDAFMQLNHKDMKKWYGEHKEFKEKFVVSWIVNL